ncbi:MAG: multiheme c-type cytochrome, partial [Blastocatellia bacterium]
MRHDQTSGSRLLKFLAIGFLLLLANSSYLASFEYPTVFYILNLGLHFGLGLLLTLLFGSFLTKSWRSMTGGSKIGSLLLLASAGLGTFILVFGATRPYFGFGKPVKWAATWHVIVGIIGVLLFALAVIRQKTQQTFARAFGFVLALALLFPLVAWQIQKYTRASRDYIVNPTNPPLSMDGEGQGPNGPFFPSSATTNTGGKIPSNFFMTSEMCARCHKEIYNQWNSSAHHFASFNNQWYRKSIEYMQDTVGTGASKWCAGCHDHAVLFNGRFDTPIKQQINTPEAQNGLS